jgi:site-specific DNA-methyltransferase (adenine-specific)
VTARGVDDGRVRWRLHQGEALAVLRSLPDASVDAVITDPPYSSGGAMRGDRMQSTTLKYVKTGTKVERPDFDGDNRDQRSFGYWCALWLAECLRIAKPGSPICVFTDWRQLPVTTDSIQAGGWIWRGIVPWDKTEGVRPQMGRFRAQAEYVVWGSAGPMGDGTDVGVLPGVIRESVRQDDKHHITGKPTAVMQWLARIAPSRGVILDPFAGSGSTGVGAMLEGRRFIGIEQSAEYCDVARARLEACAPNISLDAYAAGQVPMFDGAKGAA